MIESNLKPDRETDQKLRAAREPLVEALGPHASPYTFLFRDSALCHGLFCWSHFRTVAHHPKMVETMKRVGQIANTNATILVEGESGTGKEVLCLQSCLPFWV